MKIERKTFNAAEFKATDAAQGIAEMIVSVFGNVDGGNEMVMPGFFAGSIAERRTPDGRPKAKGVWCHDWLSPIAKTLDAREIYAGDPSLPRSLKDLGGLWVKAQFNLDTQRGREAFSDLQFGTIDEFSIGYGVTSDEWDTKSGVRKLVKGDWYEWSPVLVGMNNATVLMGTKGTNTGKHNPADCPGQYVGDPSTMSAVEREDRPKTELCSGCDPSIPIKAADGDSEPLGQPYADHLEAVLAAVTELVERSKSLADLRSKSGRAISQSRLDRMGTVRDMMRQMADELDAMMIEAMPVPAKATLSIDYLERRLRASALMLANVS